MKDRDSISAILSQWKRQPHIIVDSGLVDSSQNILPIELETRINSYTFIQVPNYCYRARYNSYRRHSIDDLTKIKTLVISIDLSLSDIAGLEGPACQVRSLHSPLPEYQFNVLAEENPVFYFFIHLSQKWDSTQYREIVRSDNISYIGKLFISSWLLEIGEVSTMAEIRAEIKKIINEEFGSEEDFVQKAVDEEGDLLLRLFTPEQLNNLSPEQLRGLKPELLNNLSPEQLRGLKPELLNNLSPEQLRGLKPELLNNLSPEQLRGLKPELLRNLTPEQLNGLTPEQLSGLDVRLLAKIDRNKLLQALKLQEESNHNS